MKRKASKPKGDFVKRPLLSANESEAFRLIFAAVGENHQVFPKVSLWSVVKNTDRHDFSRIASQHVDFIITGKAGTVTVAAIELDDNSHTGQRAEYRDGKKDYFLNKAGIPVIRIRLPELQQTPPEALHAKIITAKADPAASYPETHEQGKSGCATIVAAIAVLLAITAAAL